MNTFIKKISFYSITFFLFLGAFFLIKNGVTNFGVKKYKDNIFLKKVEYFSDFINKNQSINLVLGSSLMEDAIVPDSLGEKWFSFSNGSQNIYQSFKFLDFYKDSVKIDTIILGINPFDFPYSYTRNRFRNAPHVRKSFIIFGEDSITSLNQHNYKKTIQAIKKANYPNLEQILGLTKKTNKILNERKVWSLQGYSGDTKTAFQKLNFKIEKSLSKSFIYYINVKEFPNMFYFDLFNNLTDSLKIKVIYIVTPKTDIYHKNLIDINKNFIWKNIVDSLNVRKISLWDYEVVNQKSFNRKQFRDDTHLSHIGAKKFTKKIRNRLRFLK